MHGRTEIADRTKLRLYLPQLDGLRFVAFFLVLLHHNATPRNYFTADSAIGSFLWRLGDWGFVGVDIFLVLSSFLIVTLLMLERESTGTISIKRFYIRRTLRIWPLYFGYVLFAMVLLPLWWPMPQPYGETLSQHLFPFLTFTGNFSYAYFPVVQYAGHLWTISMEEQFYLMIPVLMILAPRLRKSLLPIGIGLLVLTAAFRFYLQWNQVRYPMIWILPVARMDPFVIGAGCAWLYATRRAWFYLPFASVSLLATALAGFGFVFTKDDYITSGSLNLAWEFTVLDLSAGALLLSALSRGWLASSLSWKPITYLGKISFGLYVFHYLAILLEEKVIGIGNHFGRSPVTWLLTLVVVLAITAALAAASYHWFEIRFLRWKQKFEAVKSRDP